MKITILMTRKLQSLARWARAVEDRNGALRYSQFMFSPIGLRLSRR